MKVLITERQKCHLMEYMDNKFIAPLRNYVDNNSYLNKLKRYAYLIPDFLLKDAKMIDETEYEQIKDLDDSDLIAYVQENGYLDAFNEYLEKFVHNNFDYLLKPDTSITFQRPQVFKSGWAYHFTSYKNARNIWLFGFKNTIPQKYMSAEHPVAA